MSMQRCEGKTKKPWFSLSRWWWWWWGGGGGGGVQFKAIVHVGVYVVCSFSIQVAVVYMCTRLIVNLTQVYTPLYLVDSLKLPKVCL